MNKLNYFILFLVSFIYHGAAAQDIFLQSGAIVYERKITLGPIIHSIPKGNPVINELLSKAPKTHSTYFTLTFDPSEALYQLAEPSQSSILPFILPNASDNTVKINEAKGIQQSSKTIEGKKIIIEDSIYRFEWKILDETRDIAGFKCRKAITRIFDSVYVVAFYSEEILGEFGPESFGGLPGVILGLAIPRLHTTWFATKVNADTTDKKNNSMIFPSNTQETVNRKTFFQKFVAPGLTNETGATLSTWWMQL